MVERSKCMNAPEIRFRGFDGEWYSIPLSNPDFTIIAGGDIDKNKIKNVGLYPVIANSTTKDGIVGYYDDCFRIEAPSVSVTGRGDVGIAQARKYNYTPVVRLLSIKSFHDVDFLSNAINKRNLIKESTGVPQLTTIQLSKIEINFPYDKNEECKIGLFIDTIDKVINVNSKKLASLKRIKAASLQSMFPQEGETVPKIRFNGFEEEWDKVKLSTLGQTYSGLTGKTKEDFNFGDSLYIPFLNVLLNPQIDESNLQKVRVENNEKQNEIHKGDILFNTSSETPEEVGLCSVFMSDIKKVYLNSFCFGFRLFNNLVDPSYIVYLLRSQIGRKLMLVLAQGATRYNLSKKSFLNAHIIIPTSQQEQQKIASYFCNLDKQISLQTQRLEKLKQIKAACLDKMFV